MAKPPRPPEAEPDEFDELLATVGLRVKEARQKIKMTQRELAAKTGFQQAYIYEMEKGESNVTLKTLAKFADALAMNIRDFFPAADGPAPAPAFSALFRVLDKALAIFSGTAAIMARTEDPAATRDEQFAALFSELKAYTALLRSLEEDAKRVQTQRVRKQ